MHIVDGPRQFVRSIMRHIASWLNQVSGGRLRPTTVTVIGAGMHLPIAVLIAAGKFVPAGILLVIFGLFDALDGELARLQHRASETGMLLDASTDRMKEVLLYSGIAYWLSTNQYHGWAAVAVLACGTSITVSYIKAKGEVALASRQKNLNHHEINNYYKEGLVPFEVRMFILVVGLLSGQILAATTLIALLATYTMFERLAIITKKL